MAGGRPRGRPRGSGRSRGPGRPPGRSRRYSDSTVASVDFGKIEYVPELSILKPIPSITEFPTFVLDDAIIYRKDTNGNMAVANVCNVNLEGPLVVRGKLEVEDDLVVHLRKRTRNKAHIEIPVCEGYSIGYGPWPAVWASGRAGWYEINPSEGYRPTHEYMCEGITLYYMVMDAYISMYKPTASKAKKMKAWQTPVEQVLFKYSVVIGDGATLPDVKERCQKHAPFLLAHFDQETEFNWKPTSFRKWLIDTNEDLVRRLDEAKKRAPPPAPASTEMPPVGTLDMEEDSSDSAQKDVRMEDAPPALPAPPRRSETYIPPPVIPPPRHHQPPAPSTPNAGAQSPFVQAEEHDPVKLLLEVLGEILDAHGGDAQTLKEGKIHAELYYRCSIKPYSASREITHFYAHALLKELPQKWDSSPFWDYLTNVVGQPFELNSLTKEQVPTQCRRRKRKDNTSSGPRDERKVEPKSQRAPAGKRWPPTTLTPRPAALRPGPSAKRPAVYHSDDDDERARKAARTSQDSEEDDGDDDTDADDTSDAADASAHKDAALATPTPAPPLETARLIVRAERIPSMSPSGPNGTWRCEEDSCNYIVRSAEEPEGKELIEKHFQDHASRVEKVTLALSEGTRGHMPINHLLEKIRSMGEKAKQKEQNQVDGVPAPQPVKRKLII